MKLKKIASLALAGVMAVSMLAGCANKPGSSDPTKEPVASDLTSAVIAALDKDTTDLATFSASADLKADAEELLAKYGSDLKTKLTTNADAVDAFQAIDAELPTKDSMNKLTVAASALKGNKYKDYIGDDNKQTATYAVTSVAAGVSTEYAVKELAKAIDKNVQTLGDSTQSAAFQNADGDDMRVNYTVTGDIAVFTVTDSTTGVVNYYAVYTLTAVGAAAEI